MFGFGQLIDILKKDPKKIVFTEGDDPRILEAASRLLAGTFLHPILIGNPDKIAAEAEECGFNIRGAEIIDPTNYDRMDEMVDLFCELRKSKGVTPEQASDQCLDNAFPGCGPFRLLQPGSGGGVAADQRVHGNAEKLPQLHQRQNIGDGFSPLPFGDGFVGIIQFFGKSGLGPPCSLSEGGNIAADPGFDLLVVHACPPAYVRSYL